MTIVRIALAVLAAVLLATTVCAIGMRFTAPFELEWLEGATVVHVARVLRGDGVYVEPSIGFVPFAYPPLYYYASAAVALVTGVGFGAVRLVSVGSAVIAAGAIGAIVRRESGALAAVAACGVFAGAYAASDGWYDLGRVDSLHLALLALCYFAAIRARSSAGWAAAGGLAFLASIAKQPAVIAMAPLAIYLVVTDRRAALWFCGTLALLAGGFLLLMTLWTDGWYAYYVLQLPRLRLGVSMRAERLLSFWTTDLLPFGIALVSGFFVAARKREWRHVALASGLVLSAWTSRLEGGAWANTLMPAHLAVAILAGLSLRPDVAAPLARHSLIAAQLAVLLYDPRPFIPTVQDRAAGEAFVQWLRSSDGPVWVVDHAYWATQAGRPEYAHGWAITDVVWADRGETGKELEEEIRHAIEQRRFTTVVLDDERFWFFGDVARRYRRAREIEGPTPRSGAPRRPALVYTTLSSAPQ